MNNARKNRTSLILMFAMLVGSVLIFTPASSQVTAQASEIPVQIVDFAFEAETLEVPAGSTVVWTNAGSAPHTVTSNTGAFDSGRLDPGATFSMTFDTPGTYSYFCEFHPDMQATVVVTDEQAEESTEAGFDADASATMTSSDEETEHGGHVPESGQPGHLAHIHAGTCDELGIVVYSFSSTQWATVAPEGSNAGPVELIAGTANVALENLFNEPFSVHIHESEDNKQNYIGCAEIGERPESPWSPEDGLALDVVEQADSGHRGVATLRPDTGGATTVTLVLVTGATEASQDEAAAAPSGTTYTSPTYGYSITFGSSWTVENEVSSGGRDRLVLTNGTSFVTATGAEAYGGDPDQCVEGFVEELLADPAVSDVEPATDERGQPIEGGTEATGAYAVYDHDYTFANGSTEPYTLYVGCIPLVPGEAVLAFAQNVPTDAYDDEVEARQALLRGLTLAQ